MIIAQPSRRSHGPANLLCTLRTLVKQKEKPTEAARRARRVLIDAAREFNAGRYFEAHEALEDGLDDVPDEIFPLFVGLIQIAVGYHKITQQLWSGAIRMLELGLEKTAPFPGDAGGLLDLDALRERAASDLARLHQERFDPASLANDRPRLKPNARGG